MLDYLHFLGLHPFLVEPWEWRYLLMLVLLISKTGVYDQIVKMKGLPYMEAHAEPYMSHLVAGAVPLNS